VFQGAIQEVVHGRVNGRQVGRFLLLGIGFVGDAHHPMEGAHATVRQHLIRHAPAA
jgi:hypothetical protein